MKEQYILNFTIPKGEMGDKGPRGSQGIPGSTGQKVMGDTAILNYNDAVSNRTISIKSAKTYPDNSKVYNIKFAEFDILEDGFYILKLSGKLSGNLLLTINEKNADNQVNPIQEFQINNNQIYLTFETQGNNSSVRDFILSIQKIFI